MRPIPGFDGYYATADGRIISKRKRGGGRPLRPSYKRGYAFVRVKANGGPQRTRTVHRLVAAAHLGLNIENRLDVVHHRNADRADNRVENLEVTSHGRNLREKDARRWAEANPFDAWLAGLGSLQHV